MAAVGVTVKTSMTIPKKIAYPGRFRRAGHSAVLLILKQDFQTQLYCGTRNKNLYFNQERLVHNVHDHLLLWYLKGVVKP